jgi:hypothetical protein
MHGKPGLDLRKSDREVCNKAERKCRQAGNCCCSGDEISFNNDLTHCVLRILQAGRIGFALALARTAGISDNGCIDADDVGHGEEGGQTGSDFRREPGVLDLFLVSRSLEAEDPTEGGSADTIIDVVYSPSDGVHRERREDRKKMREKHNN